MSTCYAPIPDISFAQLFDGRLEKHGVREEIGAATTERTRYLIGRDGFLEVHREEKGTCTFTCRGPIPWSIFDTIAEEFEVEFVSEHDHRYWGFATEEEWNAFNDKLAKQHEDEFYNDLLNYVRGKPNGLKPGTIGMIQAKIAKTLVESDPSFLASEKRGVFLDAIRAIYKRDHAVIVTLTDQELAACEMMVARTDDLPKG